MSTPLAGTPGPRFCPSCGTPLAGAAVCSRCGRKAPTAQAPGVAVWRADLGVTHGRALLTPAVAAGAWCLPTEQGELIAREARDGAARWRRRLDEHGAATAVAAAGTLLLVGLADTRPIPQGRRPLLALDVGTGATVWRFETEAHSLSAPTVFGDTVFCTGSDGRLYAVGLDGTLRWSAEHPAWGPEAPAVVAGVVLAGGRGPTLAAYAADGGAALWRLEGDAWFAGPIAVAGPRAFTVSFDGTLHAVEVAGGKPLWTLRGERGRGFTTAPVAAADRLWIGDRVGGARDRGYAVRGRGAAAGAELGRAAAQKPVALVALAADLLLCCAEDGACLALDPATLAERWRFVGAAPAAALPALAGGRVILADAAGAVVALSTGVPPPAPAAADLIAAGDRGSAATLLEVAGELAQALPLRRSLGEWRRVAELAAQLGLPDEEAPARERLGELPAAAAAYEQAAAKAEAAGESGRETAALLLVNAAALYDQLSNPERAAACRAAIGRLRRTPDLVTVGRARSALVEQEWNELDLEIRNVGHGPARNVLVQIGGPFDTSVPVSIQQVLPGIPVRSVARLRPRAGEIGPAVPLELRATYEDPRGHRMEEREEISVAVLARGSPEVARPIQITAGGARAAAEPRQPVETLELPLTVRFGALAGGVAEVRWEAETIGVVSSSFRPPFVGADLALVIRALDELQRPAGGLAAAELARLAALGLPLEGGLLQPDAHRAVGRAIYAAVTADAEAGQALDTIRNVAVAHSRTAVVRLHFAPETAALAALPWELIWGEEEEPLLLSRGQLIGCTRHLDLAQALPPPRPRDGPLRLTAVAPAAGIDPADRAEEQARRLAALAPLVDRGALLVDEVPAPVTPRALNNHFDATGPPDIIHFVGHGRHLEGKGYLVLDREGGGFDPVPAERIVQLFRGARLAVLQACQSTAAGDAGLRSAVGPALSAAGVPAVVAMQLTVRLEAATRFAERLYGALARGESLQTAVSLGRQALYSEERDGASWYVPTLTIRARDPGPLYLAGREL